MGCIGLVAGIFLLELVVKNRIEKQKEEGKEETICGGALLIRKYHNKGAFLNAGETKRGWVAFLSCILTADILLLFMAVSRRKGSRILRTGLALLLGGALSNTYDRLKRGYVVDYFSFGVRWEWLRRIVFNVSDFCILAGALLAACSQEEIK